MSRLTDKQVVEFSQVLYNARKSSQEVEPLTKSFENFSLEDAYLIQAHGVQKRLADREKIIGYKMGLTSKAKMEQMGLHTPIFGVLTDQMEVKNGSTFSLKDKIHPKAEPELFFITSRELKGSITEEEAQTACSRVGVALEILDSRYKGFKYFTLPDVVADNSSSSFFVLGEAVQPKINADFKNLKIEILENEKVIYSDSSNAILGNPILSLCELVKLLSEQGLALPSGSIVLAGAATAAIELKLGQTISARLEDVGSATFHIN
ncbi:fumarylacetoacetate hydrolase family protein [bacterium]|nr:fumarylacetoacetate hydrolase family protein [bacterium]